MTFAFIFSISLLRTQFSWFSLILKPFFLLSSIIFFSFTTGAYGQFMGAAVAETLGMVVFIPGELVRMRMMNDPGRYSSFIQASFTQTTIHVSSYTRILLLTYTYTRTALHVSTLLLYSGCAQNHPKRRRSYDVQAFSLKALLRLYSGSIKALSRLY